MLRWYGDMNLGTFWKLSVGFSLKSGFYHFRVVLFLLCQIVVTHGLKTLEKSLIAVSRKCFKDSVSHTKEDLA